MNEIILFGGIMLAGLVFFLILKSKKRKGQGQSTQNYDDKIDRVVEQLDNL